MFTNNCRSIRQRNCVLPNTKTCFILATRLSGGRTTNTLKMHHRPCRSYKCGHVSRWRNIKITNEQWESHECVCLLKRYPSADTGISSLISASGSLITENISPMTYVFLIKYALSFVTPDSFLGSLKELFQLQRLCSQDMMVVMNGERVHVWREAVACFEVATIPAFPLRD